MRRDLTVPVYLITGFLDAGKSNFLKFTMQEEYFNDGSKTLLIVTEEGEEEFSPELLKKTRTEMVVVEEESELTSAFFEGLQKKYRPERVLIEYNGLYSVPNILNTPMPKNWQFYQVITICDGENFRLYLNNIRNVAMDHLRNTDMVIFNRCTEDAPLAEYQRAYRSVNPRGELVFESPDGKELEPPEPDLPYKLDTDPIVITDEDWGTFYIDLTEHHERYEGKRVQLLVQCMKDKRFQKNLFIGGRKAMTCCVEDIRFLPYLFIYEKADQVVNKSFASVTAEVRWQEHEMYEEPGPVFYVTEMRTVTRPKEEVVSF